MHVLGIETSCDETAAAVVRDARTVLSNVVTSSLKEHQRYGGVIPEIASRRQLEFMYPIVQEALAQAHLDIRAIDGVAVTRAPGLIGSLLVGVSFARALAWALRKPLVEVDHIEAHAYANFLCEEQPTLPAVVLVVSGGHTSLYGVKDIRHFKLLGKTIDDAAGEAFDKVARILGLGYPGGPAIDRLAKTVSETPISFSCAALSGTWNFSFSGIKTAVLYHWRKKDAYHRGTVAQVAHAFQKSVVDILVQKSLAACRKLKSKTLLIGGGVAANSSLRKHLQQRAREDGINVYLPRLDLCMDNAAMIAGLGSHMLI